jgi:hypothetical protein
MIGVVHLVWAPLGPEVVQRFAKSYCAHPAGTEHTLAVIYNGFDGAGDPRLHACRAALEGCPHEPLVLEQPVQDITAYHLAAERLPGSTLCFLNSFSRLLADDWLALLSAGHAATGVGLAGATGSWASPLTQLRYELGLGGKYAVAQGDRTRALARMRELNEASQGASATEHVAVRKLRTARLMARRILVFPPFPNHHVRTNGFIVDRDVLLQMRVGAMRDKLSAWGFEGGRRGLTRQIEALGLRAVVVGRDGRAYERGEWPHSHTLWQGDQENLLIADNQTDAYQQGDAELRAVLSAFAWGLHADPGGAAR